MSGTGCSSQSHHCQPVHTVNIWNRDNTFLSMSQRVC